MKTQVETLFTMNEKLKSAREKAASAQSLTTFFESHINSMSPVLDTISTDRNYNLIIELKRNQRETLESMSDFASTSKLEARALQGSTIILDSYIESENGMITVFNELLKDRT